MAAIDLLSAATAAYFNTDVTDSFGARITRGEREAIQALEQQDAGRSSDPTAQKAIMGLVELQQMAIGPDSDYLGGLIERIADRQWHGYTSEDCYQRR